MLFDKRLLEGLHEWDDDIVDSEDIAILIESLRQQKMVEIMWHVEEDDFVAIFRENSDADKRGKKFHNRLDKWKTSI